MSSEWNNDGGDSTKDNQNTTAHQQQDSELCKSAPENDVKGDSEPAPETSLKPDVSLSRGIHPDVESRDGDKTDSSGYCEDTMSTLVTAREVLQTEFSDAQHGVSFRSEREFVSAIGSDLVNNEVASAVSSGVAMDCEEGENTTTESSATGKDESSEKSECSDSFSTEDQSTTKSIRFLNDATADKNSSFFNISDNALNSSSNQNSLCILTNDNSSSIAKESTESKSLSTSNTESNFESSSSDRTSDETSSSYYTNAEQSNEKGLLNNRSPTSPEQSRDVESFSTDFETCSYLDEMQDHNTELTLPSKVDGLTEHTSGSQPTSSEFVSTGNVSSASLGESSFEFTNEDAESKPDVSTNVSDLATMDSNYHLTGANEAFSGGGGDLDEVGYSEENARKVNELYKQMTLNHDNFSKENPDGSKKLEDANDDDVMGAEPLSANDVQCQLLKRTESMMTDVTMSNISTCVNYSTSDVGDVDEILNNENDVISDMGLVGQSEGDVERTASHNVDGGAESAVIGGDEVCDTSGTELGREKGEKEVDLSGGSTLVDSEFVCPDDTCEDDNNNSTAEASARLRDVADNEWDDILGSGSLRKKVLRAGYGEDTKPKKGEMVTVNYSLCTKDTRAVLVEQTRLDFVLGDCDVIDALDLCVQLMQMNEHCLVHSDARFAFGEAGYVPSENKSDIAHDLHAWPSVEVAPNTDVELSIELLNARDLPPDFAMYTTEQLLHALTRKKEKGNFFCKRGEWEKAMAGYNQALKMLKNEEGELKLSEDQLNHWRVALYNNMALTQIKTNIFRQAVASCDLALEIDPHNRKALFRKAKALEGVGEILEAIGVLKSARDLSPRDKEINTLMLELQERYKDEMKVEKEVYKKMMKEMTVKSDLKDKHPDDQKSAPSESQRGLNRTHFLLAIAFLVIAAAVGQKLYFSFLESSN